MHHGPHRHRHQHQHREERLERRLRRFRQRRARLGLALPTERRDLLEAYRRDLEERLADVSEEIRRLDEARGGAPADTQG